MNFKNIVFYSCLLFLASCGSKKHTVQTKKKSKVVLVEPKPEVITSISLEEYISKQETKNLNKKIVNYIEQYAPIAVKEMQKHKIPASITMAQGILESNSGTSALASKSNNHFGIKCHTNWQGEKVYHDDDQRGECFRKYQYVATSYNDHSMFLVQRKRYAFLFDYSIYDYKKWAKGLQKAGYATDKKYPNKLINIIETYKLHKLDRVNENTNAEEELNEETEIETQIEPPVNTIANYYQVQKGDTLYSIAKKFNTEVAILKEINGLTDNTISIGQHLLTK